MKIQLNIYKFIIVFLVGSKAFAFTLTDSAGSHFNDLKVTLNISADSCSTVGITTNTLLDLVEEAADLYWNSVTTSGIELIRGGILAETINGDATVSAAFNKASAASILIGCSTNTTLFTSSSDTTYAVGSHFNNMGIVLINANDAGVFKTSDDARRKAVLAHELGHALGIGHSSSEVALMYFQIGNFKVQEHLSNDDKDAITYLYPNEKIKGSCGTIKYIDDIDGNSSDIALSLLFLLSLGAAITGIRVRKVQW